MKAVKIKCYQPIASFRKPTSLTFKESYPLPPYSTVIGFIHRTCGFDDYVDMDVSIQGISSSHVFDIANEYIFKENYSFEGKEKERARHQIYYEFNGKLCGVTKTVNMIEEIIDLELVLHIAPKDEKYIEKIYKGIKSPKKYPSLGRYSDLVRIDDVSIQELKLLKEDDDEYGLQFAKLNAYLPVTEEIKNELGSMYATTFRLNKKYKIENGIRRWEKQVEALFISKGNDTFVTVIDEENDAVYLA